MGGPRALLSLPPRGRATRAGEGLLLGAVALALLVSASLHLQPRPDERAPEPVPVHLQVTPVELQAGDWGEYTAGPGWAQARGEALLTRVGSVLFLLLALIATLGYLASAGVVAVARRFELRLRRAVGAPVAALRAALRAETLRHAGGALAAAALGAAVFLHPSGPVRRWGPGSEAVVPALAIPPGTVAVLLAAGVFALLVAGAHAVVRSGEALPGGPLDPGAALGEPYRGELSHPAVPVLQLVGVTVALACGTLFVRGAELHPTGAQPLGAPQLEFALLEAVAPGSDASGSDAPGPARPPAPDAGATPAPSALTSVTTPGFWEGIGHLRFALTECGRCFIRGQPPAPAPYKGDVVVHHGVSPDTFLLADIRVVEGRAFTAADHTEAAPVAIVSRDFADEHFEGGDAVGRRIRIGDRGGRWHDVVGIIEPLPRPSAAARTQFEGEVLVPVAQLRPAVVEVAGAAASRLRAGTRVAPDPVADPWVASLPVSSAPAGPDATLHRSGELVVVRHGTLGERRAAVERGEAGHRRSWTGAGILGAVLALLGTFLAVGRRVREEAPELAVRRAVGASRIRLVGRAVGFGLRLGLLGSGLGAWATLFAMAALAPTAFQSPGAVVSLFVGLVVGLTAATAATAGVAAAVVLRGPVVRELAAQG